MPKIQTGPETHNYTETPRCPLCGLNANVYRRKNPDDLFEGWCERCGDVCITLPAVEEAKSQGKAHLVSAWLRRRPANEPATIINTEGVDRILKDIPEYSVLDKLDLTLVQVSSMTSEPGQRSTFMVSSDDPLVYARSQDEATFYVKQLATLGYVKEEAATARMTAQGYLRLSEVQRTNRESPFVFVAMWFDASLNQIYDEAIEPAIREAGYKAVRIDRVHHANRIDDEIVGRIKGSRFMVADFTGQRHGVYFEAGLMLGLGRTVIWMCKKAELNEIHFDTRQYNFIDYTDISEAKKRLYDRIIAIEGEGQEGKK